MLLVSILLGVKVWRALANGTAHSFWGQVSLDQLLFCIRIRVLGKRLQEWL